MKPMYAALCNTYVRICSMLKDVCQVLPAWKNLSISPSLAQNCVDEFVLRLSDHCVAFVGA
jgi:hypothetical protein